MQKTPTNALLAMLLLFLNSLRHIAADAFTASLNSRFARLFTWSHLEKPDPLGHDAAFFDQHPECKDFWVKLLEYKLEAGVIQKGDLAVSKYLLECRPVDSWQAALVVRICTRSKRNVDRKPPVT